MRKKYEQLRSEIGMDNLIEMVRSSLLELPDPRNRVITHRFHDIVMSGFAMFNLKYPSIHQFEKQTKAEQENLQQLFKIEQLCSDAHLRKVLDKIDPTALRDLYPKGIALLRRVGVLRDYALPKKQLICSIDGVQHFCSDTIHCAQCHERNHRNGSVTYSHSMLCAALVHPDQREVFVMDSEPIIKQDGQTKNDCELNAVNRLFDSLSEKYKDYNLLIVEDALYANGPHLEKIQKNEWDFVVNIKPKQHKLLFKLFETRKTQKSAKFHQIKTKDGTMHRFWYDNDLPLNEASADVRVNVLFYEEEKPNGKIQKFSWATSYKLFAKNVFKIMRMGRSRWKIENETFNTLKNQGYNFEHNFGHGFQFLATFLAFLMLLAFQIDQIFQRCNETFNKIWTAAKTKVKLWTILKSVFAVRIVYSFKELYAIVAELFFVQLE